MPSIAELLLAKAQQQGQMWNNIGRDIASVPATIAQAQEQGRRATLEKIAVQNAQDVQRGQQTFDQAMQPVQPQGPQEPGAAPQQPSHPYLDETGAYDIPKLTNVLAANGMGHLAPALLKNASDHNQAITNYQEAQQKLSNAQAIMYGTWANGVQQLRKTGVPTDQAINATGQTFTARGVVKPEDVAAMTQKLTALPPEAQDAFLSNLVDQADRLTSKNLSEGAKEIGGVSGNVLASNAPKPPAPSEASLAADAANPSSPTAAQSKTALALLQESKKENKAGEIKFGRVDGQGPVVAAVFDPGSKKLTYRGLDVTDRFQAPEDPAEKQAAAVAAQVAQQSRAQNFQQLIKAKEDLEKNVVTPYVTARAGAENLRDIVKGAQAGNKVEAQLQSLATTFAEVRSQGLNRVNAVELGLPASAGNLWDRLQGWFGKAEKGQPVPADIQKDMLDFADLLDRASYRKYSEGHKAVNSTWGTNIQPFFGAPQGTEATPSGLPAVGSTFQGGKVLKVEKVK